MKLVATKKIAKVDTPVTTSRQVAEHFGKRHDNVMRNIDALKTEASSFFIESSYKDGTGRTLKQYLLTRDGFTLLAMGFTGSKALAFKLQYIEAFNTMESALRISFCYTPSMKSAISLLLTSSFLIASGPSFSQSKRLLKDIYSDHQVTFYCDCTYDLTNKGNMIDRKSCGYVPPLGN